MNSQNKNMVTTLLFALLLLSLTACGTQAENEPPFQEPPPEMIPGYIPEGFEIDSSFEMTFSEGGRKPLALHSPLGNSTWAVHYKDDKEYIGIFMSDFPGGTLDEWFDIFQNTLIDDCECFPRRSNDRLQDNGGGRFPEIIEEQTIAGTRVKILKGPMGWITAFVYFQQSLVVEGTISLEENLKIIASFLEE